ncbi:MAG: TIGR03435 family protein, partial [Acidobacteriota bacterium]
KVGRHWVSIPMTLCRLILFFALTGSVFGQTPLKFEVATIKPSASTGTANRVVPGGGGRIAFQNMTLRLLVYWAYGSGLSTALKVSGGPDWGNRDRFDIQALAPGNPTERQFRMMLRSLLEERFAMKWHAETETNDVYLLTMARNDGKLGPKVQEWDGTCGGRAPAGGDDDPDVPRCGAGYRPPGMVLEGVTMFSVAEMLSLPQSRSELGTIVEDRTGLKGRYKMELEYQFGAARPNAAGIPDLGAPSILNAVREQWGLKLELGKGTLRVVAIDSAQAPTEN